jgi:hypothetical protein
MTPNFSLGIYILILVQNTVPPKLFFFHSSTLIFVILPSNLGLGNTQRQARELISGPSLGTKTKVLSFNRTQSRAVIGLLTSHNTLRRHLYPLGLQDSPLCRKCGVMEETSAHIFCKCETLASLRHAYLGSFFLEPKDIQSISLGTIWSFSNASGLPLSDMGHKGPAKKRPRCIGAVRSWTIDILTLSPSNCIKWNAETLK